MLGIPTASRRRISCRRLDKNGRINIKAKEDSEATDFEKPMCPIEILHSYRSPLVRAPLRGSH